MSEYPPMICCSCGAEYSVQKTSPIYPDHPIATIFMFLATAHNAMSLCPICEEVFKKVQDLPRAIRQRREAVKSEKDKKIEELTEEIRKLKRDIQDCKGWHTYIRCKKCEHLILKGYCCSTCGDDPTYKEEEKK